MDDFLQAAEIDISAMSTTNDGWPPCLCDICKSGICEPLLKLNPIPKCAQSLVNCCKVDCKADCRMKMSAILPDK